MTVKERQEVRRLVRDHAYRAWTNAYLEAAPQTRIAGREWYDNAHLWCRVKAGEYRMPTSAVAAIVAVLSPRLQWSRNLEAAEHVLAHRTRPSGVFKASADKALAIVHGADPYDTLRGNKVGAFYKALMGDPTAGVIDAIMLKAASLAPRVVERAGMYDDLAYALRGAARDVGQEPARFQAVVWVHTRNGRHA